MPSSKTPKEKATKSIRRLFYKTLRSPAHDCFIRLLRETRQKKKLTQLDVAKQLGVRQSLISDIERGERRVDVVEFLQLAEAYQFDSAKFLKQLRNAIQ